MIEQALKALNIASLNPMQKATVEAANEPGDIILLSPTGTGKTLAFLLPLLSSLDKNSHEVQALILTPSRELATQIEQVAKRISEGFKINCCYGGHAFKVEARSLEHPPAILIGTPGRIADHISKGTVDTKSVKFLVLDEFDKSLEMGFTDQMSFIISSLPALSKRILTSATNLEELPDYTGVKDPVLINFLKEEKEEGLQVNYIRTRSADKTEDLYRLLCHIGDESSIVFCNHREAVDRAGDFLYDRGLSFCEFHGGLDQEQREQALIKLRNGSCRVLISTDLASRGLDIPEIRNVIHYQLPPTEEIYIHRNGRTARMTAEGTSWLMLTEEEYLPPFIQEEATLIELPANCKNPEPPQWTTVYIGAGKKDKVNKIDIVGFLLKKGDLPKDAVGLIEVKDFISFVAIRTAKVKQLLMKVKAEKIKNKKVRVEIAR